MLHITSEIQEKTVTVHVEGRVDSTNSADFEKKISQLDIQEKLVLDLRHLDYISSAGLRVVLRLRKKHADLLLTNVSHDVYEILKMTGFTEMMKIKPAHRVMSLEGAELIGRGANGCVYRIDPDTVVKVYTNDNCLEEIEHEREVAKKAFLLGVPTAISYNVVKIDGKYASMFEMVKSKSISQLLAENVDSLEEYVRIYVDLLKQIHETEVPEGQLPDQLDALKTWVQFLENYLPQIVYNKIKKLIDEIPKDNHMIHGDYHIKNVMVDNNETMLIDMDTLAVGHPLLEMAAIYNTYEGFHLLSTENCKPFLGVDYEVIHRFYKTFLQMYYETTDEQILSDMEQRAKLVGLIRLLRRSIRRNLSEEIIETYRNELISAVSMIEHLI